MSEIIRLPHESKQPQDPQLPVIEDMRSKILSSVESIDETIRSLHVLNSQSKLMNMDPVIASLIAIRKALTDKQSGSFRDQGELTSVLNRLNTLNRSLKMIFSAFQAERQLTAAAIL